MQKKIIIGLLFLVAFAIFALFGATELIAQIYPERCTITTNGGPMTIEAIKRNGEFPFITDSSDTEFPCPCPDPENPACPPDNKCYVFAYDVVGHDAGEIGYIFGLFPRCINSIKLIGAGGQSPLPTGFISPPCDDKSLWPDVCSGYQVKLAIDPISADKSRLYFFTTVADAGVMDLRLNSRMFCKDGIIGTACGEAPGGVAASVQTCVNNYGKDEDPNDTVHYWFFRANDASGCIDPTEKFEICTGPCPRTYADESGDCEELPAAQSSKHILASGLQGQKCNDEATNTTYGNSPFYHYETWSGGYYYEACYDYAVPGWVNPNNCP